MKARARRAWNNKPSCRKAKTHSAVKKMKAWHEFAVPPSEAYKNAQTANGLSTATVTAQGEVCPAQRMAETAKRQESRHRADNVRRWTAHVVPERSVCKQRVRRCNGR